MASKAPPRSDADASEVYLSYAPADAVWAEDLARELDRVGLRSFSHLNVASGDSWAERIDKALGRSGALVVLWSLAAAESELVRSEIADLETLGRRASRKRLIVPVVLGDPDVLGAAPSAVSTRRAVFIGPEGYAAGPEGAAEEWKPALDEIVDTIVHSIRDAPSESAPLPSETPTTLGGFSTSARRALTYASNHGWRPTQRTATASNGRAARRAT